MATATKTSIRPLDDRVIIKPKDAETQTASGIFLPEGATEKPMQGTIIATGPGKLKDDGERAPLAVKKGDTVVYGKYAGTEVEHDGDTIVLMRESELLGIITK